MQHRFRFVGRYIPAALGDVENTLSAVLDGQQCRESGCIDMQRR